VPCKSAGCLDRRPAAKPNWHVDVHWRGSKVIPVVDPDPSSELPREVSQRETPTDLSRSALVFLLTFCHAPAMLTLIISVGLFTAMGTLTLMALFRRWP
jgi:hypothetical protein